MDGQIEFTNLPEFLRALQREADALSDRVEGNVGELGGLIAEGARARVDVVSGETKASIGVRPGRDERGRYTEIFVGTDQAWYHEFGTVHMAAEPFFRPALASGIAQARRVLER